MSVQGAVGGSIAQRVAERIGGAQRSGNQFKAPCVAHDDKNPSLSLRDGEDGRLLAHCFAGCKWSDIEPKLVEMGFSRHELLGPDRTGESAAYPYRASGVVVRQKVRQPGKVFRWEQPDGNGGWKSGAGDGPSVLYRFPEVMASDPRMPVYVCEGERDVEVLRCHGYVATSAPNGADTWKPEYAAAFRGRDVRIVPDNDPPGVKHGREVGDSLVSIARSIKWLKLPYKDPREFFEAGGETASEAFDELAEFAPEFVPDSESRSRSPEEDKPILLSLSPKEKRERKKIVSLEKVRGVVGVAEPPPVEFLLEDWIPRDYSSKIFCEGGVGKSYFLLAVCIHVALGIPFLGLKTRKATVLYLDAELDYNEFMRRFYAIMRGLEMSEAEFPTNLHYLDLRDIGVSLLEPETFARWEEIIEHYGVEYPVIDSFMAASAESDQVKSGEVGSLTQKLRNIGTSTNIDHVARHSIGKKDSGSYGAVSKDNFTRSLIALEYDEATNVRTLVQRKANVSKKATALSFEMSFDMATVQNARGEFEEDAQGNLRKALQVTFRRLSEDDQRVIQARESNAAETIHGVLADAGEEGIEVKAIMTQTGLGQSTVYKHLRSLKKQNRVKAEKKGHWRALAPVGTL